MLLRSRRKYLMLPQILWAYDQVTFGCYNRFQ